MLDAAVAARNAERRVMHPGILMVVGTHAVASWMGARAYGPRAVAGCAVVLAAVTGSAGAGRAASSGAPASWPPAHSAAHTRRRGLAIPTSPSTPPEATST